MHRSKRTRSVLFTLLSFFLLAAPQMRAQNNPDTTAAPQVKQRPSENPAAQSAAARVRARRRERIQALIQDIYSHKYEFYAGGGYQRFRPGDTLQNATELAWNAGVTDYFRRRLGVTVDARGYYGTAYTYNNPQNQAYEPSISQYTFLAGPQFRITQGPRYAISVRALGGISHGNFDTNTGGLPGSLLGLYPNGNALAVGVGLPLDYNLGPGLAIRVTPDFLYTRFGSSNQYNRGFTAGFVYRFGRQ